jgi:hypothetical protein
MKSVWQLNVGSSVAMQPLKGFVPSHAPFAFGPSILGLDSSRYWFTGSRRNRVTYPVRQHPRVALLVLSLAQVLG